MTDTVAQAVSDALPRDSCSRWFLNTADPQRQRLNKRTRSHEEIETSVALTARVVKQTVIDAR